MISLQAKKKIEEYIDDLVDRAQDIINSTEIYKKPAKGKDMEESQLRNLLNITTASESVKVINLFIQYQMGRDRDRWTRGGFGDRIIEEIENLENMAEQVSKETGQNKKEVWIELIRLFIGYLNRYFIYRKKRGEG